MHQRIFSVVKHDNTFEKFEYVCNEKLLEISLASKKSGPWTCLDDEFVDLYKAEMGVILITFPDTKYIRLECVELEPQNNTNDAGTETTPSTKTFDIMTQSQGHLNKRSLPGNVLAGTIKGVTCLSSFRIGA